MDEDGVRYRRFHVLGSDGQATKGNVTAAILYDGEEMGEHLYRVQFSYSSPRERVPNKKYGQMLAKLRLISTDPDRGSIVVSLPEKNKGLTQTIKELIVDEARRKRIRWLMNSTADQLV